MKEYWCIYRITNNINGKTYIGQHKYRDEDDPMRYYRGSGILLKQAYQKYGKENFTIEVLYKRIQYQDTANSMEIWAIEKERKENVNGCYNLANGGKGSHPMSEKTKKILAKINKGNKHCLGYKHSEEAKRKISNAHKGHHLSEETKQKISKTLKGRPRQYKHSEETRKKMSLAIKGKNTWARDSHWYNNGIVSVMTYECPEGFIPGRLYRRKNNE